MLLVRKAVGSRLMPAANSLSRTSLKQRFLMMRTAPSARRRAARSLLLLPLAACAVWGFAEPESVRRFAEARTLRQIAAAPQSVAARPAPAEAGAEIPEALPDTALRMPRPAAPSASSADGFPKDMGTGCALSELGEGEEVAFFLNRRRVSEAELRRHVTLRRSPDGRSLFAYIPKGQDGRHLALSASVPPMSRDLYGVDGPVIAVETRRAAPADSLGPVSEPYR